MKVSFTLTKRGKEVTFKNTSQEVPEGSNYLWDFGVDNLKSTDKDPKDPITYENQGFYNISLKITTPNGESLTANDSVGISDSGYPTLPDTIYNIIELYIPDNLIKYITQKDKRVYIEKWQLYIQPLVNHEVKIEDYNNEFAYNPLENQLIVELAAYDWMMTGIMNLMQSVSTMVEDTTSSSEATEPTGENGNVKKIVTGPSEVEFFDTAISGEEVSSLTKSLNSALQPGGLLDSIKANICMLSQRLEIYLPICDKVSNIVIPKVVNRRNPGLLGGPNPKFPVKK